jgi:hypothetical protein
MDHSLHDDGIPLWDMFTEDFITWMTTNGFWRLLMTFAFSCHGGNRIRLN